MLQDTREFLAWLAGSSARGVSASWSEWHRGELAALRDDDGKQVDGKGAEEEGFECGRRGLCGGK